MNGRVERQGDPIYTPANIVNGEYIYIFFSNICWHQLNNNMFFDDAPDNNGANPAQKNGTILLNVLQL